MAIVDFDKHTADGVAGVHGAGMIGTNGPFLDTTSAGFQPSESRQTWDGRYGKTGWKCCSGSPLQRLSLIGSPD